MSVIRMVSQHFGSVPFVLLVCLLPTSCCVLPVIRLSLSARLIPLVENKKLVVVSSPRQQATHGARERRGRWVRCGSRWHL